MAKKVISDIEKGVGFLAGFIPLLMNEVRRLDVPFEAMHRLVTDDGMATVTKLVEVIKADWFASQPKPVPVVLDPTLTDITVTVDYDKTVEQMIELLECDGFVDRANLTSKNFPVERTGVQERNGKLAHFNRNMTDAAVDAWCSANGYVRGTTLETLAVGVANRELQRQFPVVAGQVASIDRYRHVVYLGSGDRERYVSLRWIIGDDDWDAGCRFVVFPK